MKNLLIWSVLTVSLGFPDIGAAQPAQPMQPVQPAQPTKPSPEFRTYVPKLGDIMAITQLRHYKLWYAAKVRNWDLAKYELDQMRNSFAAAIMFYPNVPEADVRTMQQPAADLRTAIAARDSQKFVAAYLELSKACTECHKAHGYPFIVIKTPGASLASPFADQSFEK